MCQKPTLSSEKKVQMCQKPTSSSESPAVLETCLNLNLSLISASVILPICMCCHSGFIFVVFVHSYVHSGFISLSDKSTAIAFHPNIPNHSKYCPKIYKYIVHCHELYRDYLWTEHTSSVSLVICFELQMFLSSS